MSSFDSSDDSVRADIVKAARRRFQHYGYTKTNLNEIAADVSMSAGNLYQYFTNKQAIALACCTQLLYERMQQLREATQDPQLTAAERLHTYALSLLSHSQDSVAHPTRSNELVELMTTGCPEIVHEKFAQQLNILGTILVHGQRSGEFKVTNVHATAKTIHAALLVLDVPGFMFMFSDKGWKQRVTDLVEILIKGLSVESRKN